MKPGRRPSTCIPYLHGPLVEGCGRVLSLEADGGRRKGRARGSCGEVIVIDATYYGGRGEGVDCSVDDVVVVRRVPETEVEELAPEQVYGVELHELFREQKQGRRRRRGGRRGGGGGQ